jgi:cytochrome c2
MRRMLARLLAIGTGLLIVAVSLLFAATQNRSPAGSVVAVVAERTSLQHGKEVYERERCVMCHSIAGKGNRRSPLDDVGSRLSPDEIRAWITAPSEMQPGIKKKAFQLSDRDLNDLVDYLLSLRG